MLKAGEEVYVVGRSHKRGYLILDYAGKQLHLPHYFTELRVNQLTNSSLKCFFMYSTVDSTPFSSYGPAPYAHHVISASATPNIQWTVTLLTDCVVLSYKLLLLLLLNHSSIIAIACVLFI